MPSLSDGVQYYSYSYIQNKLRNNQSDFFNQEILSRAIYFSLVPTVSLTIVFDTIVGLGTGVFSMIKKGEHQRAKHLSLTYLKSSRLLIASPYLNLMLTLNPSAKFDENSLQTGSGEGAITQFCSNFIKTSLYHSSNSSYPLKRHVLSRLTFALLMISCVITRVIDGILGALAAVFSFLTLGNIRWLNHVAVRGLQFPGLLRDIYYCSLGIINPQCLTSLPVRSTMEVESD